MSESLPRKEVGAAELARRRRASRRCPTTRFICKQDGEVVRAEHPREPNEGCNQYALKDALSVPSARTQHALNMHSACTLHALMMYLLRAARASSRWSNGSTKGERRERPAAMMRMGCRQPSMLRGSERRQLGDHQEAIRRQLGEYQLDLDLNLTCQREASCRCERRPGASRGGVRGASAPAEDPREPDEGGNQLMRSLRTTESQRAHIRQWSQRAHIRQWERRSETIRGH